MQTVYILMPSNGSEQVDEWIRLGMELQMAGKIQEAQAKYKQAIRLDPRNYVATQNLATTYAALNQNNDAILTIERAAIYAGENHTDIYRNWALMAFNVGDISKAMEVAKKACDLAPEYINSLFTYAMIAASAGNPDISFDYYNRILKIDPKHPEAGINACFVQSLIENNPEQLRKQRDKWYSVQSKPEKIERHNNDLDPQRKLRVGYVGGDFKSHSASFIFSRVLLNHSTEIEPYFYSSLPTEPTVDPNSKKFRDVAGDRWREIISINDEDADRMIRKDRIDILVDLAAHTCGGRLGLFIRKPAPVQVTAWGFAHGTGCPEIDYFFADPIVVPEDERKHFAEKIFDLPCVVTMNPPVDYGFKDSSQPPLWRNGYLTFGVYARYEKLLEECLKTYAQILKRVPDSKIEFKDAAYHKPHAIKRIMGLMPDIDPARMLFSLGTNHHDHMLAYQQADICLDEWPHGGGVVCLEQLYMGVPLLTKYGNQPSGRTAASVLTAMGRKDWVTYSLHDFVEKAVEMAADHKMLADARKTLRQELLSSPVVAGYTEAVEAAYRKMWSDYCESR